MGACKLVLVSASFVLGAPLAANAAVMLDSVFLAADTQVHANAATDNGVITFTSPWGATTATSFNKSTSASASSAGATANGASDVTATLTSPAQGSYGLTQSVALSNSAASSVSSGWANGEFVYWFDLTGTGLYQMALNGQVTGGDHPALLTSLIDLTTHTTLFSETDGVGDSLSTTISNLNAGRYALRTINTVPVHATVDGAGSASPQVQGHYQFSISGAVPEPEVWAMLLLGFFGLGAMLRARTSKDAPLAGRA